MPPGMVSALHSSAPNAEAPRRPVIGAIFNPRSHRNSGRVSAMEGQPQVHIAQPEKRGAIAPVLADFRAKGVELLAISGGDGTVRDVLTRGYGVYGEDWPLLAVIPRGKTNALAIDLGVPAGWTLAEAADAAGAGRRVVRQPLLVRSLDDPGRPPVLAFLLGAGAFTTGTRAGQDAHRLGAFDSLAVAGTVGWGLAQAFFGTARNPWRRGTRMTITLPDGGELPHSGRGDAGRRALVLASTMRRFPAGLRPFAGAQGSGPVQLAVMDVLRRRLLLALPAVMFGHNAPWMARAGMRRLAVSGFEFAIGDAFILDGEEFPAGRYCVEAGPRLEFVIP